VRESPDHQPPPLPRHQTHSRPVTTSVRSAIRMNSPRRQVFYVYLRVEGIERWHEALRLICRPESSGATAIWRRGSWRAPMVLQRR